MKYAGLASQLLVSLGLSVYAGLWLDKHLIKSTPIFVWVLPLFILTGTIIKIIKDTSK
jgi:hypothetical protein